MKCGGFSNTEVNEEHIDIINSKRDEIENILIKILSCVRCITMS
jgi:hypothetical protein